MDAAALVFLSTFSLDGVPVVNRRAGIALLLCFQRARS
jgi:hypothetical protein